MYFVIRMNNKFAFVCIVISFLFISCSNESQKGKWVESEEGIDVFVPLDFDDKYEKSTLSCISNGFTEETNLPCSPFEISVDTKSDKAQREKLANIILPTIISLDSLKHKSSDGSLFLLAGNIENDIIEGYAWKYSFTQDNLLSIAEIGKFKDNELVFGDKICYDNTKGSTVVLRGRFRHGNIYMGIKQIQYHDSISEKSIAVWEEDGIPNPTYAKQAKQLYSICEAKGYNIEKIEQESVDFAHRYFFWLRFKWWFFIVLSIIGLIVVVYPLVLIRPSDCVGGRAWDIENYRIKPWSSFGVLWRQLFFGWLGLDKIYLRQYGWASVENFVLWVTIVASSKFIVLYGVRPNLWLSLLPSVFDYWQSSLLIVWIFFSLFDYLLIPYKVYKLNFSVYRKNIYENLILESKMIGYENLCIQILDTIKRDGSRIKDYAKNARSEYTEEQGLFSRSFSWLTNSKVEFARKKAEMLNKDLNKLSKIAESHRDLLTRLLEYMDTERKNAYRNMILAKELIFLIKKGKGNQQALRKDNIGKLRIDTPQILVSPPGNLPEVGFVDSVAKGYETFESAFSSFKEMGFDDKDSLVVGLGIGAIEASLDCITQINSRRAEERRHYEYLSSNLIQDINNIESKLLETHTKMLRAREIMLALSAANAAFVKAYTPLRDHVFGTEVSFMGFLSSIGRKHKIKARELAVDNIGYLISICNEYNKINTSKI